MLTRKGVVVDKAQLMPADVALIRNELTVAIPSTFPGQPGARAGAAGTFEIFLESPNRLCLPRYYARAKKGLQVNEVRNSQAVVECHDLEFVGTVNPHKQQDKAIAAALEAFRVHGGGVLSLPTGFGKTVVAINIMCQVKVKTLIVVHKEFLLSQWEERIRQFAPSARVGFLRQNVTDTSGKHVVIGMLQSILAKDYSPEMLAEFGLVIFDEVHHLSAPTFSKSLFSLCAPFVLGLSATPERKDGLDWVLEYFIGPVFFMIKRTDEAHVQVRRVPYLLDLSDSFGELPRMSTGMCYDSTKIITLLSSCTERSAFIAQLVCDISRDRPTRKVLVLAERREHCKQLCDTLAARLPAGVTAAVYMGGMKKALLKEAEKASVILATFSFANEGLDIQGLDTLVYATPKGDVVQSAGRILRDGGKGAQSACAGADFNRPTIYDIVDAHKYFEGKYKKRTAFYKKSGFEIVQHQLPEDAALAPPARDGLDALVFVADD